MRRLLLSLLLLLRLLSAGSIDALSTIDDSGSVTTYFTLHFPDGASQSVTLIIEGEVDSVSVKDRSGLDQPFQVTRSGEYTLVSATIPADTLVFKTISNGQTSKTGPSWEYGLSFGLSESLGSVSASLTLPPGSIIKSTNGAVSGSADSLRIDWESGPMDSSHKVSLRAGYELGDAADLGIETYLIGLGLLALLIISALFYLGIGFRKEDHERRNGPPATEIESPARTPAPPGTSSLDSDPVFRTLDETDRAIIREIASQRGKTTQARIHLNTHIPKVTLSRRLDSLETRGIIQKSRKGIRNLVSLTDSIKS